MATINRFEDLLAWQKAKALSDLVIELSDRAPWRRDWGLRGQIRESSNSVPANIAEGFNRRGDKQFRQYLRQAKGSAGETRNHAYTARQAGLLTIAELEEIRSVSDECERLIQAFINYLTKSLEKAQSQQNNDQ